MELPATHLTAFLFLFPIGIRRLLCCFSLSLKSPLLFRAKPWYLSEPKWKNIDLYILLISLPIATFSEFFLFLNFSGHPTYRFAFSQHAAVLFFFWFIVILIILRENFDFSPFNDNLAFLFAGIVFLVEYLVLGNGYTGLSGRVYELLCALTLICAASCIALSFKPAAFFADVVLSLSLMFKGTWILQSGLSLFSDAFVPKGCHKLEALQSREKSDVQCDLEDDRLRGIALIDLLFVGHAIGILIFSLVSFGALASKRNLRCGGGTSQLSIVETESDGMTMRSFHEFE